MEIRDKENNFIGIFIDLNTVGLIGLTVVIFFSITGLAVQVRKKK